METCVIFCAAEFDAPAEPIRSGDRVVAADGGLHHVHRLGLAADAVLGDFDSLGYVPEGGVVHPVEKDDTDAMLAVRWGLERGLRRFVIYGGMDGRRLDHTVANFQTLQYLARQGCVGYLVGRDTVATVIGNGKITFPPSAQGIVSVFCMGEDARGVTISGLKYTLENGVLTSAMPLGVSNAFVGKTGEISVENGDLLILWDRKNGIVERDPL